MSPQSLETLTFSQVVGGMVVILILVYIYNTVMAAVKTHREERLRKTQPVNSMEAIIREHEEKLKRDYERLNELESGNRIMMRAMMAMLSHEINGNSDDKLKLSYDEIQKYLIER